MAASTSMGAAVTSIAFAHPPRISSFHPLPLGPLSFPEVRARSKRKHEPRIRADFSRVLMQDREILKKKLGPVIAPLSRLQSRVSRSLGDFFWLRHLEDVRHSDPGPPETVTWPNPSYPGLCGADLIMADLEALKLYANYFYQISKFWSIPLPEVYDAQKVSIYFNCRPHILGVRVLEVFSSFALAALKMQTSKRFKLLKDGREASKEEESYYFGQLLKESLLRLGPTFIKVGQSLSTRPDIVGPEISQALSELHENIPPFPRSEAIKIIEEELGHPVDSVFSYISESTVAAASFGQVYQGCTIDGCKVAIKVQRPSLLHVVVRDIYILRLGLGILRKVAKRKNDIRLYADELGKGFVGELDYRLEAINVTEFQEAHYPYSFIVVPKILTHLSSKKVLTMTWLSGENTNDLLLMSTGSGHYGDAYSSNQRLDAKKRLLDAVNMGVKATLIQLLDTGLLHADPHPGNLRYTQGQIGLLDFGLLCRMEKKHQLAMLASIIHIVTGDWAALIQDLSDMDVVPPGSNIRLVTMDLEHSLGNVPSIDEIPDIKFSRVLGKIWSIALKYHFRMPTYYTLVLRSLASLEGLAVAADPDFKTFQAACPFVVQKLMYENSSAMRRILYSVVFSKRREFQWKKLSLFLRIGLTRDNIDGSAKSDKDLHSDLTKKRVNVIDIANFILWLLPSKNGTVLRRLLMDADSASLARDVLSNEAFIFRQYASQALADAIYQLTVNSFSKNSIGIHQTDQHSLKKEKDRHFGRKFHNTSAPIILTVLKDRRLRVIFYKAMNSIKSNPILLLRFCWSCLSICTLTFGLVFYRLVCSLSEICITTVLSSAPRKVAITM